MGAGGGTIDGPATAAGQADPEPAVRLRLDRTIGFPVERSAELVMLDNFGGNSFANGPGGHRGIDIWRRDGAPGHPLVACVDGVLVEQNLLTGNQGNSWVLQDDAGDAYRYHHLESFADGLEVGDRVALGQVIGNMGDTGNPSAPHLHFEVRRGGPIGTAVDPVPFLLLPIPGVAIL